MSIGSRCLWDLQGPIASRGIDQYQTFAGLCRDCDVLFDGCFLFFDERVRLGAAVGGPQSAGDSPAGGVADELEGRRGLAPAIQEGLIRVSGYRRALRDCWNGRDRINADQPRARGHHPDLRRLFPVGEGVEREGARRLLVLDHSAKTLRLRPGGVQRLKKEDSVIRPRVDFEVEKNRPVSLRLLDVYRLRAVALILLECAGERRPSRFGWGHRARRSGFVVCRLVGVGTLGPGRRRRGRGRRRLGGGFVLAVLHELRDEDDGGRDGDDRHHRHDRQTDFACEERLPRRAVKAERHARAEIR